MAISGCAMHNIAPAVASECTSMHKGSVVMRR